MNFIFSESARQDYKKLPKKEAARLKKKLIYWQSLDKPLEAAKTLTKHLEATHRFRAGAYRVLVKASGNEIRVLRLRHRKDVYKS